jgi:putative ABC transport system substrate-binding protein
MKRRDFITLLGGAAVWPLPARAQQPALPVIGFLNPASPEIATNSILQFRKGLAESGYVEGENVLIEYRWAHNDNSRLPELAADLARRRVAVIATGGGAAALAAKAATTTIPIIFQLGTDPVQTGLVASLNRPDGNLTGVTTLGSELAPKRLDLLHELVPAATNIALLVNPTNPDSESQSTRAQAAASSFGLQFTVLKASTGQDLVSVFETLPPLRPVALVIAADPFLINQREQIGALTLRHAVPAIYQFREFAAAGGLMSYGSSLADSVRLAGVYVGRILKGEKPANLPVQQSTKVELVINLKTAKALGLTVPPSLLARADEVIE